MLGCDLKSLKRKYVVTNSRVLSAKILESSTHLGAEPHSIQTLVAALYEHPAFEETNSAQKRLTDEEREFLGEAIKIKLADGNYFKTAFQLSGLRQLVFQCLDELRVAGYSPADLKKGKIDNKKKLESLSEVFELYTGFLEQTQVFDYPMMLKEVINRLQKDRYAAILKQIDILFPFELDLRGMESSLIQFIDEKGTTFRPGQAMGTFLSDTEPRSQSLAQFKRTLGAFLQKEPLSPPSSAQKLDASVVLKASLTPGYTLAAVFEWMRRSGANVGNTAIVSPNYDTYAGPLYRFCKENGIPLNLSHGLLASEFSFFAEAMARLSSFAMGKSNDAFLSGVDKQLRNIGSDDTAYVFFQRLAMSFLSRYKEARNTFRITELKNDHAWEILRAELYETHIPLSSLELDRQGLFLGRPEDLLGVQVDHLAIVGLQDHNYPPKVVPDAILTDDERGALNQDVEQGAYLHDLRLSTPPALQKDLLEKLSLGVRKTLFLGFESHDLGTGSLSLPSSFLNRALNSFGYPQKAESLYQLSGLPEDFVPSQDGAVFLNYDLYLASKREKGESYERWNERIGKLTAPELNDEDGALFASPDPAWLTDRYSASKLATFFACPYAFFLENIIGIEPLERTEKGRLEWLDAMDWGSYLHAVFEGLAKEFLAQADGGLDWPRFLEKYGVGLLPALMEKAEVKTNVTPNERIPAAIIKQQRAAVEETAVKFIQIEIAHAKETGFTPIKLEEKFKDVKYSWGKGKDKKELTFSGSADRLDCNGKSVYRIIDYKTGKNRYKNNENLFLDKDGYVHFQHVIYGLWATQKVEPAIKPENLSCGYYFTSDRSDWATVIAPFQESLPHFDKLISLFHDSLARGEFRKNADSCNGCGFRLVCGGAQDKRKLLTNPPEQIKNIDAALAGNDENGESNDE